MALAVVTTLVVGLLPLQLPAAAATALVWHDEFTGRAGTAPSARSWTHDVGGGGWGNGELQCYTASTDNSSVDGRGHLLITARERPGTRCAGGRRNHYTSARLTTRGLRSLRYGTLVVRARMPTGSGAWPAIWLLGTDIGHVGWPACGEIDVAEVVGRLPQQVRSSLHSKSALGPTSLTRTRDLPVDLSRGFHDYSMRWTPDSVSFAVDGRTYNTATRVAMTLALGSWPFTHDFYLLLNVAVGGVLPGPPTSRSRWPQTMAVDYVRVYR